MPRILILCLGILAIAAPAASATNYTATDTASAQTAINTAAGTQGPNTVTLAAGSYDPLHVPSHPGMLKLIGSGGGTIVTSLSATGDGDVTIRRLQLVNSGTALTVTPGVNTMNVGVDNAIVRGNISRSGGSGTANISLQEVTQYSAAPPSLSASGGSTSFILANSILGAAPASGLTMSCAFSGLPASFSAPNCAAGSGGNTANPSNLADLFVNLAAADFHLAPNSAAIDRGSGEIVNISQESPTDLDGNPRDVPYANCTTPLRDQGAYEALPIAHPPNVAITGPATSAVGDSALFQMTGPEAATVQNAQWSFSDGGTGSGPQVAHTWTAVGTPTITLTATNGGGCRNVVRAIVTVNPPAVPDKTPPVVSNAKLSPTAFKSGSKPKLTLTLSEAATVTASIYRRDPGVRKGGKCLAPKKGRKGKSCARYIFIRRVAFIMPKGKSSVKVPVGKLRRAHYRLSLTAADAAKNHSKVAHVGFDIKKS